MMLGEFPEDKKDIYERSIVLKEFIQQYKDANNVKGKIAVVTHTTMISAMTARKYNHEWHKFIDATRASNGQMIPLQLKNERNIGI